MESPGSTGPQVAAYGPPPTAPVAYAPQPQRQQSSTASKAILALLLVVVGVIVIGAIASAQSELQGSMSDLENTRDTGYFYCDGIPYDSAQDAPDRCFD